MSIGNTIWVADDEKSIRWVLDKALSKEGLQVTCFESAESLLARFQDEKPEVIVSDIRMHGMDGLAMLAEIKQTCPDLPVIIMTAHSDLDSAVSSIQGGAFEYIPKPFEVDEAVSVVKRALANLSESKDPQSTVDYDPRMRSSEKPLPCRRYFALSDVSPALMSQC